jgi:hypothetical protein
LGGHFVVTSDEEFGVAVFGEAEATTPTYNRGGFFAAHGRYGTGVYGYADGDYSTGVAARAEGVEGIGVSASAVGGGNPSDPNVHNYGGHFTADGRGARGVYGEATYSEDPNSLVGYGGYFVAETGTGVGVYGRGHHGGSFRSQVENGTAIRAVASTPCRYGVYGRGKYGVMGETYSNGGRAIEGTGFMGPAAGAYAGYFEGNMYVQDARVEVAWGDKNFVQPHPTDPSKQIVYTCLEGGESGVYVRGSGQLDRGRAEIALPEHFALVAAEDGLTAQAAPRDGTAGGYLYVEAVSPERLVVAEAGGGTSDASFDFLVMGRPRGVEEREIIQESHYMEPAQDMSQEEFEEWAGQDRHRGIRQLLIENGSLTADGRINHQTAEQLGWKLGPKTKAERQARRWPGRDRDLGRQQVRR